MPNIEIIAQLGSAGVVIYVVILFLKELKEIRIERNTERSEWLGILVANQKSMDAIVEKCTVRNKEQTRRQDASSLT